MLARRRSKYRVNHGGHFLGTLLTGGLWGIAWAADAGAKRSARERRDAANVLPRDWAARRRAVYKRDRGICQWCRRSVSWSDYHCDHIYPRALGGHPSAMRNLQTLCGPCNLRKGSSVIPGMQGLWLPSRDPRNNPHLVSPVKSTPSPVRRAQSSSEPARRLTPPATPTRNASVVLTERANELAARGASFHTMATMLVEARLPGSASFTDVAVGCDHQGCSRQCVKYDLNIRVDAETTATDIVRQMYAPAAAQGWVHKSGRDYCPAHRADTK